MTLRQKLKRLSVLLDISEPEEVSPGVYRTTLSHPKLEGALHFVHSKAGGRDEFLAALDENIVGQIFDVLDVVGEMLDGRKTNPSATSSASPAREAT